MTINPEELFPAGTPVQVIQQVELRRGVVAPAVYGVVEKWEDMPTGSWYAHGKKDRLWLRRLILKKADGEITILVIDNQTHIARLERAAG